MTDGDVLVRYRPDANDWACKVVGERDDSTSSPDKQMALAWACLQANERQVWLDEDGSGDYIEHDCQK